MTPKRAFLALQAALRARRPIFLWGSPGIGKSSIVAQLAGAMNVSLIDLRAVLLDPVDVKGLPVPDGDVVRWLIASFFPRAGEGILFLDELNLAPRLVQSALYQLVLDRRIGDYSLPERWHIVAAGNLETDRAHVERMSTALARRFLHITVEPDAKEFLEYGSTQDFHPVILALVQAHPELLFNFDPKSNERTFSCPSTLEFASQVLYSEPHPSVELELLQGTVGQGVGAEIVAFKRYLDQIPDADDIILRPDAATVPDYSTAQGLGILCVLIQVLVRKATRTNLPAILRYAQRLPEEFRIHLVVFDD